MACDCIYRTLSNNVDPFVTRSTFCENDTFHLQLELNDTVTRHNTLQSNGRCHFRNSRQQTMARISRHLRIRYNPRQRQVNNGI